jgi:hypothetical protein
LLLRGHQFWMTVSGGSGQNQQQTETYRKRTVYGNRHTYILLVDRREMKIGGLALCSRGQRDDHSSRHGNKKG